MPTPEETQKFARIAELQEKIKQSRKTTGKQIAEKVDKLKSTNLLGTFSGVALYKDRIEGDGRVIPLGSDVQVALESHGEISYTPLTSGGTARPTLTRMAVGGMIAGPLGAVIGGTAQKQKGIKTTVQTNDNRTVVLTIASEKNGYITRTAPGMDEAAARDFVTKILNAKVDYPKFKQTIAADEAEAEQEIKELRKNDPAVKMQRELDSLLTTLPADQREAAAKLNNEIGATSGIALVGIFVGLIPFFGFIMPIVALYKFSKIKKQYGVVNGDLRFALVAAIIGLAICTVMTALYIISGGDASKITGKS